MALRLNTFCSSVPNKIFNESNVKPSSNAWKILRRETVFYGNGSQHTRLYHRCTTRLQVEDSDDTKKSLDHGAKPSGVSPRALTLLLSSINLPCSPRARSMLTPVEDYQMTTSARYLSSMVGRSKLDFSTMPHSTSANSSKEQKQNNENMDIESMPASKKVKALFKKYGSVFVGTYFGIYFSTLFAFFITLDFGLLDPDTLSQVFKVSKDLACETGDIIGPPGTGVSMNEAANAYAEEMNTEITNDKRTMVEIITGYLHNWDWTRKYAEKLSDNPHVANFALAWFLVKFTEPIRLAGAVIVTPKVAQALGRKEAEVDADKNQ